MAKELDDTQRIERSLITTYRKRIWNPFILAVKRYALVKAGDQIAVCISGGKDSMLLAKLMQELHRHSDVPFGLRFLVMDPGYTPRNREQIERNAARLRIPIEIFESNIFEVADDLSGENPCYMCARMRRGWLYARAQEMGCNKIALGHHFNDVIETTLIGMFYGSQLQAMPPKLHSRNFPGMELIRPLYCVHEDDIVAWKNYNKLEFIQCACRFTERAAIEAGASKRQEIKEMLRNLRKNSPDLEKSIFNSIHAVCMDTMVGWKSKGETHSFLENYDARGEADAKPGEKF